MSGLPETTNARVFLTAISQRFYVSNNVEAGNLMSALIEAKYDSSKGVREFSLRIVDIQSMLRNHEIPINDNFVVNHTLNSLPIDFSQIKTTYIAQSQIWSINDMITKCVAEEEKLKKERSETVNLVAQSKTHSKGKWKNKKFKSHGPKNDKSFKKRDSDQA
ncbi:hypothetical protein Pint_02823 [Pistacia integerrima]|uniref:Uncharacterized protein n=1 Tax=Pistacia integerrima TaxID=434235 RepID=A0ACC0ZNV0_9ROSI|nr:hypothetical protein Pint_02823 [Pistacia integerrima]